MSFRERSAWLMGALMLLSGSLFAWLWIGSYAVAAAVPFVLITVIGSIIVQVLLAISSPREATSPADERERIISDRAGHWSSYPLAAGVVIALGMFLVTGDDDALFGTVLASLIVASLGDYVLQILLARRSL